MEVFAPVLSKRAVIIANLTPDKCFSGACHIVYHEGQNFIYLLLHVFVGLLGTVLIYIENEPDPVP